MSKQAVMEIMERVRTDPEFRKQAERDPERMLANYDLTEEERQALLGKDPAKLEAMGVKVETRLSKGVF